MPLTAWSPSLFPSPPGGRGVGGRFQGSCLLANPAFWAPETAARVPVVELKMGEPHGSLDCRICCLFLLCFLPCPCTSGTRITSPYHVERSSWRGGASNPKCKLCPSRAQPHPQLAAHVPSHTCFTPQVTVLYRRGIHTSVPFNSIGVGLASTQGTK
jgi:hypothetical protein